MRFICLAKDRNGKQVTERINAADRNTVIEVFRSRGLTPVSIIPEKESQGVSIFGSPKKLLLLGSVCFLILIFTTYLIRRESGNPSSSLTVAQTSSRKGSQKVASSEIVKDISPEKTGTRNIVQSETDDHSEIDGNQKISFSEHLADKPKEGGPKIVVIDGKTTLLLNPEAATNNPTVGPIFQTETESALAVYAQPGVAMPPPPNISIRDIKQALAKPIVVNPGDTPHIVAVKESVAAMKEDLKKHLDEGGDLTGFFKILAKRQEEEASLVSNARGIVQQLLEEGDWDAAAKAADESDALFAERGMPPLKLGPKYRKQLKAARARK